MWESGNMLAKLLLFSSWLISLLTCCSAQSVEFSHESSDLSVQYSIVASKILRPSTVYQVLVSLSSESKPCRVMASISRSGVAVSSNELPVLGPGEVQEILLKVPPDNSGHDGIHSNYLLRIEGKHRGQPYLDAYAKVYAFKNAYTYLNI